MHVKGLAIEDLVRCSTLECSVGHDAVVLLDVEGHELLDRGEAIEPIQIEPVVLQVALLLPPPKLVKLVPCEFRTDLIADSGRT